MGLAASNRNPPRTEYMMSLNACGRTFPCAEASLSQKSACNDKRGHRVHYLTACTKRTTTEPQSRPSTAAEDRPPRIRLFFSRYVDVIRDKVAMLVNLARKSARSILWIRNQLSVSLTSRKLSMYWRVNIRSVTTRLPDFCDH